jgi:alpha-D-xyloside xylohydrolase
MDGFRRTVELKYRLMPYIYAQAKDSSERGLPMVRALFVEYPTDPGSWTVEDEYLFGADILVAPLFETAATGRNVYLPPGQWIDYQTGKAYSGGWHAIQAGAIPVVMLVREGAVVPHIRLAQSTKDMDWANLDLVVYATTAPSAQGLICLPSDNVLHRIALPRGTGDYRLARNPLAGRSALIVRLYTSGAK